MRATFLVPTAFVLCLLVSVAQATRPTDINQDGVVDMLDLALLCEDWLWEAPEPPDPNDELAFVPGGALQGGTFEMGGGLGEGGDDELPVHTVTVDSFYMGRYDITNRQYCEYLNSALGQGLIEVTSGRVYQAGSGTSYLYCDTSTSNSYSQILYSGDSFTVRTKGLRSMVNDPMVCVTWYGAAAYCNWRSDQKGYERCYNLSTWECDFSRKGYRLPTEAEWEYSARGGLVGKRFPWGDTIAHSQANYHSRVDYSYDTSATRGYHPGWYDGVSPYTSVVGSFTANDYGIYDMAGNVRQWCNDWYSSSWYLSSPSHNPTGPENGTDRVVRGGAWDTDAYTCRTADRDCNTPEDCSGNMGFRMALAAEVVVPDVVGLARPDAEAAITVAGLVVGTVSEEFSDTVPEGCVIGQSPLAGQTVLPGSPVNLVVSKGPGGITPDDMVLIPGGTFEMGDNLGDGWSGELPVHTVTVDSFYMGKYEITNQQYCDYLNSARSQGLITVTNGEVYKAGSGTSYPYCDTSTSSSYSQIAYNGSTFSVRTKGGRSMVNDPMVCVTWYGAVAYCNWRSGQLGKQPCYDSSTLLPIYPLRNGVRLATEAEWEYAARGGLSGRRFPWGNDIYHTQANYWSSSSYSYDKGPTRGDHPLWYDGVWPYTSPVGFFDGALKYKSAYNWPGSATSYQTTNGGNGYGLYDMAGNVWEWCNDWWSDSYYSSSPSSNPTGPTSGSSRVVRGGCWNDNAAYCRAATRHSYPPVYRNRSFGFRVALDL